MVPHGRRLVRRGGGGGGVVKAEYSAKVELALAACTGYTAADFAALAIACADQAGMSVYDQRRLRADLGKCVDGIEDAEVAS